MPPISSRSSPRPETPRAWRARSRRSAPLAVPATTTTGRVRAVSEQVDPPVIPVRHRSALAFARAGFDRTPAGNTRASTVGPVKPDHDGWGEDHDGWGE